MDTENSKIPHSPVHEFWERMTLVISGPSGVGKSTLLRRLLERFPWLEFSVSHTTRPPRPGEIDGRDYYFRSEEAFREIKAADGFVEDAIVHGFSYGTSRSELARIRSLGKTPLLEVDVQGALSVRARDSKATLIMLLPPSFEALRERLHLRRSEDPALQERRLSRAREELKLVNEYNYYVVNDDQDAALDELTTLLRALALQVYYLRPEFLRALEA